MSWWIVFEDGEKGCVGYGNIEPDPYDYDHAKQFAAKLKGKSVKEIFGLPYNAPPMLQSYPGCEPWCSTPEECKGRSSCPHRYACSE